MWACRATRQAKNATEVSPRTPTRAITPTMIRMAFSAPPPEVDAGAGTGGGTEPAATGAGDEDSTAAPHLLQNLVPGVMLVPQELQNAMSHLVRAQGCRLSARVYRRNGGGSMLKLGHSWSDRGAIPEQRARTPAGQPPGRRRYRLF